MSGYRGDGYVGGKQAFSETSLDCKGALGTKPCTSVFFGKGHAPNTSTGSRQRRHNRERNRNNPSTLKDLSRRSRSTATIVGVSQCDRRSSQWVEPLTTWSSRPSDSAESRNIPPEVRELVGTLRRKNRHRRRNRCRNVHLDGKRIHEKKSDELKTVAPSSTHRPAGMVPTSCQKPGEASRVCSVSHSEAR